MKNPVAKHMRTFNRPSIQKDKKKALKRGERKHKGSFSPSFCDILPLWEILLISLGLTDMAYRIKHNPTGMYCCPVRKVRNPAGSGFVKSNLSKTGKIYATLGHAKSGLHSYLGFIYDPYSTPPHGKHREYGIVSYPSMIDLDIEEV